MSTNTKQHIIEVLISTVFEELEQNSKRYDLGILTDVEKIETDSNLIMKTAKMIMALTN